AVFSGAARRAPHLRRVSRDDRVRDLFSEGRAVAAEAGDPRVGRMLQESERRRLHLPAMNAAPCLPPRPVGHAVSFAVPSGAWDAHIHAIGAVEHFPLAQDRSYTPAVAPIATYVALMDELGLAQAVLVQPSIYGIDNRALLDALARH